MIPRGPALTLAALLAAGVLLAAPAAARADGASPPADGVPSASGVPPYAPADAALRAEGGLRAWLERVEAAAATAPDARARAEHLYSGAHAAEGGAGDDPALLRRAAALYVRVVDGSAPDDPLRALALLRLLGVSLSVGNLEAAAAHAALIEQRTQAPLDPDPLTARRWAVFERERATTYPLLAAAVLAGRGATDAAVARLVALAEAPPPGFTRSVAWVLERAARTAAAGGQRARADALAARALSQGPTDAERARLSFWRLHLAQGLLAPDGTLRPTGARPGPTFVEEVQALLPPLAGNPQLLEHLLSSASSALLGSDDAAAWALYQRALAEPGLAERVAALPALLDGLLAAVPAAIRLGRLAEADAFLTALEALGPPAPPPGAPFGALHRTLRDEVRQARQAGEAARAAPGEPRGRKPTADDGGSPGELRLPRSDDPVERAPGPGPAGEGREPPATGPGPASPVGLAAAAAALLLLAWAVASARARGRRRRP